MEKEIDKVLRLFHQEGAIAHEVKEIRQEEDVSLRFVPTALPVNS